VFASDKRPNSPCSLFACSLAICVCKLGIQHQLGGVGDMRDDYLRSGWMDYTQWFNCSRRRDMIDEYRDNEWTLRRWIWAVVSDVKLIMM
jgi:hypothetical protein